MLLLLSHSLYIDPLFISINAVMVRTIDHQMSHNPIYMYEDVKSNVFPEGQPQQLESDPHCGPFYTEEDAGRASLRAQQLANKAIGNAPSWEKELPWTELTDCTLEELIIYFPNHVARWPGLALYLLSKNWDRLFYRTARLINMARGSDRTEYQHIEVLPLVFKLQRAIRQIDPEGLLSIQDLTGDVVRRYILRKPDGLRTCRTCKLEEAAYFVGTHEFADRPFSRKMAALNPAIQQSPQSHAFPFADTLFTAQAQNNIGSAIPLTQPVLVGQHYNNSNSQRNTGRVDPSVNLGAAGTFSPAHQISFSTTPMARPSNVYTYDPMQQIVFTNPGVATTSTFFPTNATRNLLPAEPQENLRVFQHAPPSPPPDAPNVISHHQGPSLFPVVSESRGVSYASEATQPPRPRHQMPTPPRSLLSVDEEEPSGRIIQKKNQACKHGSSCRNKARCKYLHPRDDRYEAVIPQRRDQASPRTTSHQRREEASDKAPPPQQTVCKHGAACRRKATCKHLHPEGQSDAAAPRQPAQPKEWFIACRNDGRNKRCTNPNCNYGHRGPLAGYDVSLGLNRRCERGAACKNATCNKGHPSPAQAAQR